jgi:GTP-binding protein EngB required for normal cell division
MEQKTEKMTLSQIRDLLQTLKDVCARFQLISLNRQMETVESLLAQNAPIDVAILGQFKAGKSSFINSLIGKSVLPVGVIPVTTAITRLQYGDKERVFVRHFDGTTTEAPLADIAAFTAEAENPGNQRNVAVVDIELPSLKGYAGLRLVDTPGLGSVFKYHKAASENWLPEVGAALLAISSDRPLSDRDLELIRELTRHTPYILLLLTKADLLTGEQQDEVIRFFQETLQRELNRELPVYLYSNRVDTDRHKRRIETEILCKLTANKEFEFRRMLRYKTQSLVQSCLNYLDIALSTSLQADQDREGLRAQILDEKVNEDLMREELMIISRENQLQTRPLIKTHLDKFYAPLAKKTIAKLEKELPVWKGNLWKLTRRYEAWMSETMTEEMEQISRAEHRHFFGTLNKSHASFTRSLLAFRKFLNENIQKILGVQLAEVEWEIDVEEPHRPDIFATRSFDIHLDLIWFLIPMFIFRRFFERHFLRGVPREVAINLSRLAAQWEKCINFVIESMRKQAAAYVREELATIEALLSKTEDRTEDIRRLMSELQEAAERLIS